MTKSFSAKSNGVSGGGRSGDLAVGGTITDGLASAIDRYIRMEVDVWAAVALFNMALEHRRDEVVAQIRQHHQQKTWDTRRREANALMLAIADVIEKA